MNQENNITIGLFTHKNADYDALCSTLSLASMLKYLTDKPITVIPIIEPSPIIDRLSNKIKTYSEEEASTIPLDYALICDVNETDRTYAISLINKVPSPKRFVIDHHDCNRVEIPTPAANKITEPSAAATCSIITDILHQKEVSIPATIRYDLYRGIAADSANFTRSVTSKTIEMVNHLHLSEEEKTCIIEEISRLSPRQQELYDRVEEENTDEPNLKVFCLLEPASSTDIAIQVKNDKFDKLTSPNEEYPVTIFIIGYGNNYFAKMKKIPSSPIDILSIAIKHNGGGHETRCSAKFLNSTYVDVIEQVISEYRILKYAQTQEDQTHKLTK